MNSIKKKQFWLNQRFWLTGWIFKLKKITWLDQDSTHWTSSIGLISKRWEERKGFRGDRFVKKEKWFFFAIRDLCVFFRWPVGILLRVFFIRQEGLCPKETGSYRLHTSNGAEKTSWRCSVLVFIFGCIWERSEGWGRFWGKRWAMAFQRESRGLILGLYGRMMLKAGSLSKGKSQEWR